MSKICFRLPRFAQVCTVVSSRSDRMKPARQAGAEGLIISFIEIILLASDERGSVRNR